MIARLLRWLDRRAELHAEVHRLRLRVAAQDAHIRRLERTLMASEAARRDEQFARELESQLGPRRSARVLRLETGGAEPAPTMPPYDLLGDAYVEPQPPRDY